MKVLVDLILGVVTSIGSFAEVGSISTAAQAGSEFGFQLLWAIAGAGLMLAMLVEMSGRLASVSRQSVAAAVRERFGIHFHVVPLTAELLIHILLLAAEIGGGSESDVSARLSSSRSMPGMSLRRCLAGLGASTNRVATQRGSPRHSRWCC